VVATMVTIALGGVFGDFIVKRNIQGFNAESEAFDQIAAETDASFSAARSGYDLALRERRRQTQRLVRNIASDNVTLFNQNYPDYDKAVKNWNEKRYAMARTILDFTDCEAKFNDANKSEEERTIAIREIKSVMKGNFSSFLSASPAKPDKAAASFLSAEKFCPTFFLTKFDTDYSVHKQFVRMHRKLVNYRLNDFIECIWRHENNRMVYYRACAANEKVDDIPVCMAKIDSMLKSNSLCEKSGFDAGNYRIRDVEFNELDYYWQFGDQFFKQFRKQYMLKQCEQKKGFWGSLLGWDCNTKISKYLEAN